MQCLLRFAITLFALAMPLSALGADLEKIRQHANIVVPVGKGPFPVVFLVPGCGGFSAQFSSAQRGWAKQGLMSVRIDLMSAYGVSSCRDLEPETAAADVIRVISALRKLPGVKPDAVNVMGISWGGAVTIAALSGGLTVDAAVLLFPACKFTRDLPAKQAEVPVLVIHGEADKIAPLSDCQEKFSLLSELRVMIFPGAPHSFLGLPNFQAETIRARSAYLEFFRR